MDCYFRQYWRDQRLSFKGLKNNANNLVINQLRRVSKVLWGPKYLMTHEPSVWTWRCWRRSGSRTHISTTGWTPTSTPSPDPTSCSEYQKTGTSPTPSGQRYCRVEIENVSVLIVLHHLLSAFQFISFGDYFWHSFYEEFWPSTSFPIKWRPLVDRMFIKTKSFGFAKTHDAS